MKRIGAIVCSILAVCIGFSGCGGGKSHNPLTRVFESNGPDVKIRGTASHVAEKYIQLARDAQASGDPVGAEKVQHSPVDEPHFAIRRHIEDLGRGGVRQQPEPFLAFSQGHFGLPVFCDIQRRTY